MKHIEHVRGMRVAMMLACGVLLTATALGACGSDNDTADSQSAAQSPGNGIDRAFVAEMIPHHESAVRMAKIAKRRGMSTFVKNLAADIARSQNAEIATMQAIAMKLDDAGVKPGDLGIAEHQMGMDNDLAALRKANPFDRAFIDMMIPHHQGAIRMARVETKKGSNAQAKKLAEQIISTQTREIDAMNMHRIDAYGSGSPAGGVPPVDSKTHNGEDDGSSMEHG
ncbi:MAG: DUF305 domain-containing protein [Actinobacteria bacterium]|nr:DUF305 domain-containing protein [Actinomycetota bacterium]MCA1699316.1 DUF305 domain-containing protein [Actinomycetota bacterium]